MSHEGWVTEFRGRSGYEGTIEIASLSREVGRRLPPHVSHQSGRDVDIRLPLLPTVPVTRRPNPDEIDWLATWALIESLLARSDVHVDAAATVASTDDNRTRTPWSRSERPSAGWHLARGPEGLH